MEKKNTATAKDFIKFSNYLIKLKYVIENTKKEIERDAEFNMLDNNK